jgi:uncharacterized membrane protein YqaE (UPF0057 family)
MMATTLRISFVLAISAIIFSSCNSRKIGFFNNHYSNYQASKSNDVNVKNEELYASIDSKIDPATSNRPAKEIFSKYEEKMPTKIDIKKASQEKKKISREDKKLIKSKIKQLVREKKEANDSNINTIILVILAILLPPLAVALVDGITGPFWLDILLTILFYVPGLIYALYRIFR